ncbi:MAG: PKD domain-containing protein [bacterium]
MEGKTILYILLIAALGISLPLAGCINTYTANLSVPVIHTVIAKPSTLSPGGKAEITVNATASYGEDEEEEAELFYSWSAEGGTIEGNGNTAIYTAPEIPGAYVITVEVSDGKGGTAIGKVVVTVENSVPVITSLTAEKYTLLPGESTKLYVTAEDDDKDALNYTWSVIGGPSSGTITWTDFIAEYTAPKSPGVYLVKVVVDDGHGAKDTASIAIQVEEPAQSP